MSLRVVDKGNVVAFPGGELADVVAAARGFADSVESGKINAKQVIVIAVVDGRVDFTVFGPSPTLCEGIGIIELAKAKIIDGSWVQQ